MSEVRVGGVRVYGQHGERHAPRGSDPTLPDVWIYVGVDPRVPFMNGSNMSPTMAIPNPVPMRFRISLGQPNDCQYGSIAGVDLWAASVDHMTGAVTPSGLDPVATSIIEYRDHQLEFQGDITGVSPGDVVFILPLEYQDAYDVPADVHDDTGAHVPCRILSTGEFVWDTP